MRLTGRVVAAVGAVIALVGTFLPWLVSGTVERTSYELLDLVERLGFSPDGLVGLALTVWPLAPLGLVLCVVAQWPWRGWQGKWAGWGAAALAVVVGLYVGATAAAVLTAPEVGLFRVRNGASVTLAGALVMLAGAAVDAAGVRREIRRGRPTDRDRSAPA
ncbi:MAG: hypothetical protein CL424_13375 [Acidimicrobiaceae bacterium]|nr:hypothetical protein [Acidimicrobiaceae bacterium]